MKSNARDMCLEYFVKNRAKEIELSREEFDTLVDNGEFSDGPYVDTYGNEYGAPYRPYPQAFGKLKDGRYVYCELRKRTPVKDS